MQNITDSTPDKTEPKGRWQFDGSVTLAFDDMLERSIPQYEVMRAAVTSIASYWLPGTVIDLGCSRGEVIARLQHPHPSSRYYGVELSEHMLAAARARFLGRPEVTIEAMDLRYAYPLVMANVTLAVLTLQFIPIEYRQRVLRRAYEQTEPGGAFILVEKILGSTYSIDERMVNQYHIMKSNNGYSRDDIERKRLSLEGVLVPVTASMNEQFLAAAGFAHIDCFWRWMNFAAWIAIKE